MHQLTRLTDYTGKPRGEEAIICMPPDDLIARPVSAQAGAVIENGRPMHLRTARGSEYPPAMEKNACTAGTPVFEPAGRDDARPAATVKPAA